MPRSLRALLFPCLHTEIAPFVAPFVVIARDAIMDEHDLSLFSLFFFKKKQMKKEKKRVQELKEQMKSMDTLGGAGNLKYDT